MFWEQFADDAGQETGVTSVLKRETFDVFDLLREDDVLQEFAMNNDLIRYFKGHLKELIDLVILDIPENLSNDERFRNPFLASQVLKFGHDIISDAFFDEDCAMLRHLLSLLDKSPPLSIVCAEYMSQVAIKLLECRKSKMLAFLSSHEQYVVRLVEHLQNPSILNLLSHLFFTCTAEFEDTEEEKKENQNCRLKRLMAPEHSRWLAKIGVPKMLVDKLHPEKETKENALEAISKLIEYCHPSLKEVDTSDIINQLTSKDCGQTLQSQLSSKSAAIESSEAVARFVSISGDCSQYSSFVVTFCSSCKGSKSSSLNLAGSKLLCSFLTNFKSDDDAIVDILVKEKLLEYFVAQFFENPNQNLFCIAVANSLKNALHSKNVALKKHALAKENVGLFLNKFSTMHGEHPHAPNFGLVLHMVEEMDMMKFDPVVSNFIEDHQDKWDLIWAKAVELLSLEKKALAGFDPGKHISKGDFLKSADIDGLEKFLKN